MNDYFKQRMLDKEQATGYNEDMSENPKRPPGPLFVALSGKKQVGKDTSASIIKRELEKNGKRVAITAFAEPLKDITINVLGLPRELVYGSNKDKDTPTHILWGNFPLSVRLKYSNETFVGEWSEKPKPRLGHMTVREVLQVMGTDIFREMFEDNIWANAPFRKNWDEYDVVILTDCRFPNEKRVVEENGGVVIRIERTTGLEDNHLSETALDNENFDVVCYNNETIDLLRGQLIHVLSEKGLL